MGKKAPSLSIPRPTKETVAKYLDKWKKEYADKEKEYEDKEKALSLLFRDKFQHNICLSEVLIKCSTLNNFYGTNIYDIFKIANHIIKPKIDIDSRLNKGDLTLVDDISLGHEIKSKKTGNDFHLFSFATKYCSHHKPEVFPIYDSYVEKALKHFREHYRKEYEFLNFRNDELRDSKKFEGIIMKFKEECGPDDFNLKQIDQYLWRIGKRLSSE